MATCKKCGKSIGWTEIRGQGVCPACHKEELVARDGINPRMEKRPQTEEQIEKVILTTETQIDLPIIERLEIVTAECAFGMNIFKDLFSGVRDIVGGRSKAVQDTMRETRRTALHELKREAHIIGANAVVG